MEARSQLDLDTRSTKIDEEFMTVVLAVTVTAKIAETAFLCEVNKQDIFTIGGNAGKRIKHI